MIMPFGKKKRQFSEAQRRTVQLSHTSNFLTCIVRQSQSENHASSGALRETWHAPTVPELWDIHGKKRT